MSKRKQEFVTPAYALRPMPDPDNLPPDELGREIALLLHDHQELSRSLPYLDLKTMTTEAKQIVLTSLREMLGIKPILKRHLDYVGD